MSPRGLVRVGHIIPRLGPAPSKEKMRTLWRAKLRIQTDRDEFLFRATEEFAQASKSAQELLETSESCKMVGAEIIGVERVAKLWN